MKKIFLIFSLFLFSIFLFSCDTKAKYDVLILEKEISENFYNYILEIKEQYDYEELKSVAYNSVNEIYQTIKQNIEDQSVFLTTTFIYKGEKILLLKYHINKNPDLPGLKLLKEVIF